MDAAEKALLNGATARNVYYYNHDHLDLPSLLFYRNYYCAKKFAKIVVE